MAQKWHCHFLYVSTSTNVNRVPHSFTVRMERKLCKNAVVEDLTTRQPFEFIFSWLKPLWGSIRFEYFFKMHYYFFCMRYTDPTARWQYRCWRLSREHFSNCMFSYLCCIVFFYHHVTPSDLSFIRPPVRTLCFFSTFHFLFSTSLPKPNSRPRPKLRGRTGKGRSLSGKNVAKL